MKDIISYIYEALRIKAGSNVKTTHYTNDYADLLDKNFDLFTHFWQAVTDYFKKYKPIDMPVVKVSKIFRKNLTLTSDERKQGDKIFTTAYFTVKFDNVPKRNGTRDMDTEIYFGSADKKDENGDRSFFVAMQVNYNNLIKGTYSKKKGELIGFEPDDRFELSGSAKHPNGMSFYQYLKEKQPEIYDLFGFNDDKKIKDA